MGENRSDLPRVEGVEETMNVPTEQDIINTLHTYFPNEPVENLVRFWDDIRNIATNCLRNYNREEL